MVLGTQVPGRVGRCQENLFVFLAYRVWLGGIVGVSTGEEEVVTEEKKTGGEILDELNALGEQLAQAVKALWDSEDARKVRQEIGDGFVGLGHQVDEAMKTAKESEAAKEFETKVKQTVDKARESDVAGQVQEGLVTGLRQLNEELSKWLGSAASREAPEAEAAGDAETEAGV
jgi:hypothetical protein